MIGTLVTVTCVVLVGVGAYLFNDGYRAHKTIGLVAEGLGWGWFFVSGLLNAQSQADANLACSLYGENCPDYSGVPESLVGGIAWVLWQAIRPLVVEALLMMAATGAGYGFARLTRRGPRPDRINAL